MLAALVLPSWLIFGNLVSWVVYHLPSSDYSGHIQFARVLLDDHQLSSPHILFELLVIGLLKTLPITIDDAGYLAGTAFYVLAVLVIYALIRSALGGRSWKSLMVAAVFALLLLLVAPINLLTVPERNLYFGYIGLNVVHNPTIVALKPFALLLFVFTVAVLSRAARFSVQVVIGGIVLVTLSVLAKPNFVLVLLPALLMVLVYRFYRRDSASFKTILAALIIPMIVLLVLEYIVNYLFINGAGGITFTLLGTIRVYDHSLVSIGIKFVLSILFPLIVFVLYARQAVRDNALTLAWLVFFIGAGQMYFLAESGKYFTDGNFWWSGQIGLFVLFVFSTIFWLRHFRDQPRWRAGLCLGIFALHLISGLIVYGVQFQSHAIGDWY